MTPEKKHAVTRIASRAGATEEEARRARIRTRRKKRSPRDKRNLVLKLARLYGEICLCCKSKVPAMELTLDHVIPLCMGGLDEIQNCQLLCWVCNGEKGERVIDYRPFPVPCAADLNQLLQKKRKRRYLCSGTKGEPPRTLSASIGAELEAKGRNPWSASES